MLSYLYLLKEVFSMEAKEAKNVYEMSKDELIKQLEKEDNVLRSPFPFIRVNQDNGFIMINGEEKIPLGTSVFFYSRYSYGQYIKFNSENFSVSYRSTIGESASECLLKDGTLAMQMKEKEGKDLKYNTYLLGFLLKDNKAEPAILVLKGEALRAFLEFKRTNDQYKSNKHKYALKLTLEKTKKSSKSPIEYFTLKVDLEEPDVEVLRQIVLRNKDVKDTYEDYIKKYNEKILSNRVPIISDNTNETENIVVIDDDEDDLNF